MNKEAKKCPYCQLHGNFVEDLDSGDMALNEIINKKEGTEQWVIYAYPPTTLIDTGKRIASRPISYCPFCGRRLDAISSKCNA